MKARLAALSAALVAATLAAPVVTVATPATAETPSRPHGPAVPRVPLGAGDVVAVTAGGPDGLDVLVPAGPDDGGWAVAGRFHVEGLDAGSWTGQSCVTGDGRYAGVTFAPATAAKPVLRDRGAWAAVLDLRTGTRWTVPERVALKYHTPGCGTGSQIAFLRHLGTDQQATEVLVVDAAASRIASRRTATGQLTSAVPAGAAVLAAMGDDLVTVDPAGHVTNRDRAGGPVFDVHPAANGAVDYLVATGETVAAYRLGNDGTRRLLASGPLRSFGIAPGRAGANRIAGSPAYVADGVAVVPAAGRPEAVALDGSLVVESVDATGETAVVSARPPAERTATETGVTAAAFPDGGSLSAPAATASSIAAPKCAVARNDPSIQVAQPTAAQVEWAANRAVRGELTTPRPPNWNNNGQTAYAPQTVFPRLGLTGGGRVPAQVLLGILAQEANLKQASYHALPGTAGNPLIADYYGTTYSADGSIIGMDYSKADCGYGIAQVTDHMTSTDPYYTAAQKKMIATDYAANMAAGLRILEEKWNLAKAQTPDPLQGNTGNPAIVENWYFAIWAYNTGIYAPAGTGVPYGVGWTNNPANTDWDPQRQHYLRVTYADAATPYKWPYQERVLGWAESAQLDYQGNRGYADLTGWLNIPGRFQFCVTEVNQCSSTYLNSTDPSKSYCTRTDRKCWWHGRSSWLDVNGPGQTENAAGYQQGAPEPAATNPHPPSCTGFESGMPTSPELAALPPTATIVDDLPTSQNVVGCPELASGGTFTLSYGSDANGNELSAIDFHQIGGGARGHFWFAHTNDPARPSHTVTGTWRAPTAATGWQRVLVHVPDHGADTFQADYKVSTGVKTLHRTVNQRWNKNVWVDLGAFSLLPGASVSLSNATYSDFAIDDDTTIAWDAVAFVPTSKPAVSYVSLGDSYAAGEGIEPYYPNADVGAKTPLRKNACHRSPQSYALGVYQDLRVRHPGTSELHFLACSGAEMPNVTGSVVHHGEVPQLMQGWLDENTTHVSISIGGNDAGFAAVIGGCIKTLTRCTWPDYYLEREGVLDPEPLIDWEPKVIRGTEPGMENVMRQIKLLAPNAVITLVGYPYVVWPGSDSDSWSCAANIDRGIAVWMKEMGDLMAEQMRDAAQRAGVAFAPAAAAFGGHEACTVGQDEWINALVLSSDSGSGHSNPGAGSFHPKASGQPAYRGVVSAALP
jgi:hypothetical protein